MNLKKILFPSLILFALVAFVFRSFAKAITTWQDSKGTSFDEIEAYIERQMCRLRIPGASLAIVEGDQITRLRGYGMARPRGEAPTPQTPFMIGSLTKSFTALAVMQLVEAGKVALDAPVQRYLPWFRVADPEASAQMTVRHLLNQTSGLPVLASQLVLAEQDDSPDATERQVRGLSGLKLSHPVGEMCQYCNLNYNILGLIIETASGESYASYIQKHIFDPLDMHHSYTTRTDARQAGLAIGHRHWFSLPFPAPNLPLPKASLPAGLLISCAEDLAHYLIAHLNGGRFGSVQILSEVGINETHRGIKEITLGKLSAGFYGMGWFEQDLNKVKIYSHGGNLPEFSAFMALVPEQKKAIVVLFNADPYGLPFITDEVGNGAAALLAGQQPAPMQLDFIQWIMRFLPVIPLLQFASAFSTLRVLQRWDKHQALRLSGGDLLVRHILLPLMPDLSLAAILVYLRSSGLIRFAHLYMPDLAWIATISGGFAAVWAFLRTFLFLRILTRSHLRAALDERFDD